MDSEFERRWREQSAPFDGVTVTTADFVPLPQFWKALTATVELLRQYLPDAQLFRLLDWHEHDGHMSPASALSWQELSELVASEASLSARFRPADFQVREGVFPAERDYYLRNYVADPDDRFHDDPKHVSCGRFDVTGPVPLILSIAHAVSGLDVGDLEILPAKMFFDDCYGG